ncbi:cupin-like domain-containing protein [Variovorax sp.]|uniref:cupin-like domain-containing protein n=1 Tax=Variovorax sp. TaxID=1871043 RepID=UPI002D61D612|nr:cupin-like domain-containing protein [Variovorax sp.]HYP83752.1 cupin-like domain-containing protein [Variovorax sp.]
MQCFEDSQDFKLLDSAAFKFTHKLLEHPALSLGNLARVLPALPASRVMYSVKQLGVSDDFENTFKQNPRAVSIEAAIENIRTSDSYIMVAGPEADPSFASLYRELVSDVDALMRRVGLGNEAIDTQLYLFIASPNSVTPFHIDRYSTFLMQFRGSKEVSVFPQWDESVVTNAQREAYVSYANSRLAWSLDKDAFGRRFTFTPGEAIHIPFVAGHHVRNGPDDVSISMSIIFNNRQSMIWRRALNFNHASRRLLGRVGLSPSPIGARKWPDKAKAAAWSAISRAREFKNP